MTIFEGSAVALVLSMSPLSNIGNTSATALVLPMFDNGDIVF